VAVFEPTHTTHETGRRRAVSRLRHEEKGQAIAEFAVILPVLALVMIGMIQVGILLFNYIDFTSAVREGARKAAVSREDPDGEQATEDAIRAATSVVDDDQIDVDVQDQPWGSGQDIEIDAEYPYTLNILGVELWEGPLSTSTVVRVE
jgi:Flp pilus assembly pilin Flp